MFELFHPFKGTITNIRVLTSSCILISRRDHVLSFINIYFSFNSNYHCFCVFLYSMYTFSKYINIIGINQKLVCTISFQAILVYLNPPNGVL